MFIKTDYMYTHKTTIRVRYADTDKMQFVYNGKYLEYFEVGRTEMLREAGLPYKVIEDKGYQLPVLSSFIEYKSPGRYDDLLEIEAVLKELPVLKIHIDYIVRRSETGEILAEGYTEHAFIREETKRATRPPEFYLEALRKYFN